MNCFMGLLKGEGSERVENGLDNCYRLNIEIISMKLVKICKTKRQGGMTEFLEEWGVNVMSDIIRFFLRRCMV